MPVPVAVEAVPFPSLLWAYKTFVCMQEEEGPSARGGFGLLCCIPVRAGLPASTSALHAAIMPTPLQDPTIEPPAEEGGMEGDQELQNLQSCGNAQACSDASV